MSATALPTFVVVAVGRSSQPLTTVHTPLLSASRWPIAFNIALTLLMRWELRACANCRAGLIAMMTIAAKIAMMPMTTRTSIRVNPRAFLNCFIELNNDHNNTQTNRRALYPTTPIFCKPNTCLRTMTLCETLKCWIFFPRNNREVNGVDHHLEMGVGILEICSCF